MRTAGRALLLAVFPCMLAAHEAGPLHPDDVWSAWPLEPGIILPLIIAAVLYGRGARQSRGVAVFEMACFWGGLAAVAAALASPLHPMGEVLFSAHMAQHELLMLVAAPLLVLSRPLTPLLWGMPFDARRALGRVSKTAPVQRVWASLTRPLTAWWSHAIVLWVWHAPVLFQATLRSEWVHSAQHLSFFVSALLFWWALFHVRDREGYGNAVFYIFTTAIHTGILGALLTFSPSVVYPAYLGTAPLWGLTPLEDQQIGGLIMWLPAGTLYMAAGLWMFWQWMRKSEAMYAG
jgi:putative membrane protein